MASGLAFITMNIPTIEIRYIIKKIGTHCIKTFVFTLIQAQPNIAIYYDRVQEI